MQSLNDRAKDPDIDVLVAGGGVAGVAAALSAARAGRSVVLAERTDRLGGIGTRGMLRSICGLYLNGNVVPTETLNGGIVREIVSVLLQRSRTSITKVGRVFVLSCSPVDLEDVLLTLCRDEQRITVAFECPVTGIRSASGKVQEAGLAGACANTVLSPKAVVDCTGNGEVAVLAGAGFELAGPDELQLAGLSVHVKGLSRLDASLPVKVPLVLAKAAEQGQVPATLRFTTFTPGDTFTEGYLKFSVKDGDREEQVGAEVQKALDVLRSQLPFFRDAAFGPMSGILQREGRRITGEYVLTAEDVLAGRKFADSVVRNSWPIELWDASRGTQYRYPPDNDYYEIPFRCLTVKGFQNLLTAGRCISASHEALGSTRVMGACIALGDAAGRAAAELVRTGRYPDFGGE